MLDFFKPSFWFQKRTSALDDARVRLEQMSQYNALFHLDPDKIVGAITAYNSGNLAQLAHIIRDLEQHDDKMATCSMKMKASVGRCDWSVLVKDGFENDERAKRHAEILRRFWSTVNVTSRFNQNERGGIRLLKKQMMEAQSFGYAVHEIVWRPLPNGEIAAEFIKLPLWHFENKTGALRFLPTTTSTDGVAMAEGEWLVTTGDGVGIPAAICAMAKRMSFQDWLLFSERSGMPIIVGKTGAAFGSDQWKNIKAAIRSIYRDTRILLDNASDVTAIDTGHAANIPFPPLVEWADRAIAALYRGADLSTISKGDGTGASLQGDESGMIEQDAAENLGETLHEQVDRFVIRYVTGDDEPLANIVIEPVTKPDVDTDIKIDRHLAELGVKLSKADALQRYGRTEAQGDDDALELAQNVPQMGLQGGLNGFANEAQPKTPFKTAGKAFKNAQGDSDGQRDAKELHALLGAFSRDLGPAAEEVEALLKAIDDAETGATGILPVALKEKATALIDRLPSLLPADPEGAAILAEAMAGAFNSVSGEGRAPSRPLANENDRVPAGNGNGGQFTGKTNQPSGSTQTETQPASDDEVNEFLSNLPDKIDPEKSKALLAKGFTDKDGDGNQVKYGKLLLDHICDPNRHENDQKARLRMLGTTVKLVRESKPISTARAGGRERVYSGVVNGKAYIAVADEHNEINAMVMVSYRRDKDNDPEVKA